MYSIKNVYGKVDRIRNLKLEGNIKKIYYMDNNKIISLAKCIIEKISESGYQTVIVSESGTVPLIEVCKKIAFKKNIKIKWFYFKTPRSKEINLAKLILSYLTEEEKNTYVSINNKKIIRENAIIEICKKINFLNYLDDSITDIEEILNILSKEIYIKDKSKLLKIIQGTTLYNIFNNKFLFFDEYVFSGVIIRNFNFYSNLFSESLNFKLGAYCILVDNIESYDKIAFSLFSNKTKDEAHEHGIYPFEDRIDLIGYYYIINKEQYLKKYVSSLRISTDLKISNSNFIIKKIEDIIIEKKLLEKLKIFSKKQQIKKYIKNEDIIRYVLKLLEEECYGRTEICSFLEQSFEMYAPIWLPMPKEYHYDYLKAFERMKYCVNDLICVDLKEKYIKYRNDLIDDIVYIYLESQEKFYKELLDSHI